MFKDGGGDDGGLKGLGLGKAEATAKADISLALVSCGWGALRTKLLLRSSAAEKGCCCCAACGGIWVVALAVVCLRLAIAAEAE